MAPDPRSYDYDVEAIRESDYPMLNGEIYLDHAGTTPYSSSLLKQYIDDMSKNLYGNPHSGSTSSQLATARIHGTRQHVLKFLQADPEHFDLVFVLNATSAMKLVADAFTSYGKDLWYGYHIDSHTSAVGIRELAHAGYHCFESNDAVEDWLENGSTANGSWPEAPNPITAKPSQIGLFSYPGQSNMTGARLPLSWPGRLRHSKNQSHDRMYSLLDAAALASTAPLDFRDPEQAADFTAISFYKIFGFPDLGGLIIRKRSAHLLRRPYFGGGTVDMVVSSDKPWHSVKGSSIHEALEDGTLPFHSIVALDYALATHQRLYGSLDQISRHTSRLTSYLYEKLTSLRHRNGNRVCQVYSDPSAKFGDSGKQGPVVAFNIRSEDGNWIRLSDLENAANECHIHLRTGDVCNPGGIARHLGLSAWELIRSFRAGVRCGCKNVMIGDKPSGIARVSLGAMSNVQDVDTFVEFIRRTFSSGVSLYVQNILVYPIQGCSAWWIADETPINVIENGLDWDGQWCLVNLQQGTILTPQEVPRLFLIYPEIDPGNHTLRVRVHRSLLAHPTAQQSLSILIDHPDEMNSKKNADTKYDVSMFWDEQRNAGVELFLYKDPEIQTFLTAVLGIHCTLARALEQALVDGISGTITDPDVLTIIDKSGQSNSYQALENGSGAIGIERPRQVSIAETLGANIVLSQSQERLTTHQDNDVYLAFIEKRHSEKSKFVAGGRRRTYHLLQIGKSSMSTQGKTPETFRASCSSRKLFWAAENVGDGVSRFQIRAGQMVLY